MKKKTQNENNSTEQEDNQDENDSDDDSDHFSEVDESETHVGNTDTLLDHIPDDNPLCDTGLTFAPGEGQRPISLYSDPDAEYLSFPTIFCGQRRPDNKDRVEFQQRGSPHIHILIWIENAPVYESDSNEDVVAFIDKYVSCSLLEND
ncbi:Hypothetical predicted protein [Mytilus galloprovincialis]|uniref:Helitron helicase-like domain-containing protein n=1 Tax=Mytilus galloprovincialis TaxID=29158 RepID=A0A8B6DR51_MYTGA|nr:Hypothetical predicted protein [Mytilus galloprovincialis]